MTKAELLKKIDALEDNDEIIFALFDDNTYKFRFLELNAQSKHDPADRFGFVINRGMPAADKLADMFV